MQRQGKRTAIVFVVLSLTLLAAHHAGLHAGHEPDATAHSAMAADHEMPTDMPTPPVPASTADAVVAICLAILPALLIAALAAVGALMLRGWWPLPPVGMRLLVVPPPPGAVLARDGPRDLCVIRC